MDQAINSFIKNKKALVVEDESSIAQLLKINLTQLGFDVETSGDAESAFKNLQTTKYDLCLLDWMLPGIQGVDFLKKIRPHHKALKVMMVTAKADADSVVMGLESGADDYLPKPFDAKVLAARVRQLMRRLQMEQELLNQLQPAAKPEADSFPDPFEFDDLKIYFSKHIVQHQNNDIHLTPSEFKLMEALIKAQGKVLTREKLID